MVVVLHPTVLVGKAQNPVANAREELGVRADGKQHHALQNLEGKEQDANDDEVAKGVEEVVKPEDEHDGRKDALARLVHDEARGVERAGAANGKARAGKAVDLRGRGAHAVGREVHEEDACRLNAHEVAYANGRVGVRDHREHVGRDANHVIDQVAEGATQDPRAVDLREAAEKHVHLAGEDEIRQVGKRDDAEKRQALVHLAHALLVGLAVLGRDGLRGVDAVLDLGAGARARLGGAASGGPGGSTGSALGGGLGLGLADTHLGANDLRLWSLGALLRHRSVLLGVLSHKHLRPASPRQAPWA